MNNDLKQQVTTPQEEPTLIQILRGIDESIAEIRSAIYSTESALHRIDNTSEPIKPEECRDVPNDLTGVLRAHSEVLMSIRQDVIGISRKINNLI